VSIYAIEKFRVTMFLTENTAAFTEYFIVSKSDRPKDTLYTLTDVYDQIEHVVESVSDYVNSSWSHIIIPKPV